MTSPSFPSPGVPFIAPEGAMQFEVTRPLSPRVANARLWVMPITQGPNVLIRQKVGCTCSTWYEIIHCEPASAWNGSWSVVCTCIGNLIE
jgi:hypothetical protein